MIQNLKSRRCRWLLTELSVHFETILEYMSIIYVTLHGVL